MLEINEIKIIKIAVGYVGAAAYLLLPGVSMLYGNALLAPARGKNSPH